MCNTLPNMLWKNQSSVVVTLSHRRDTSWTEIKSEGTFSFWHLSLWPRGLLTCRFCGQLRLLRTKVHPCRHLTARPAAAQTLSGSCEIPSNQCGPSHRPTEWTSPCRSPTEDHRRSDTAGPEEGVYWRLVSSCWGNGTCSPHWRERRVMEIVLDCKDLMNSFETSTQI